MQGYVSDMSSDKKKKIRKELSAIHGWKCFYCGIKLIPDGEFESIVSVNEYGFYIIPDGYSYPVLDHKLPRVRGGKNEIGNLALSCTTCNCEKNDRTPEEYYEYRRKNLR